MPQELRNMTAVLFFFCFDEEILISMLSYLMTNREAEVLGMQNKTGAIEMLIHAFRPK
jgi:hypothetical protein